MTQYWVQTAPPFPPQDGRNMVKFMIQAVKHVVQAIVQSKRTTSEESQVSLKPSESLSAAQEMEVFVRLLRYGIKCLDIFMIPTQGSTARSSSTGGVRTKDEKDSLECFAHTFSLLNTDTFVEIFSTQIHVCPCLPSQYVRSSS